MRSHYFKKGYLYQKYIIEKLSTCKLAEENQCSSTCIIKALKRNGIPLRSLSEARKLRITSFETRQKMSRSLSGCNAPWYGKYGEKSSNWKGGRFEHNGYIYIFNNQKRNKNVLRYIAEHRLIAEHILGRSLHKNEQVHHINENRGDNRNCNLLICTRSYHGWLHKKMNAQNSSVSRLANSNRGKE